MSALSLNAGLMAAFYLLAGLNHFRDPGFYLPMMPAWVPAHGAMVALSGLAEVALGLGILWPVSRPWAAWGVIALLIAVFPANLQMFLDADQWADIPHWALALRLPLQGVLIAWAWTLTRT